MTKIEKIKEDLKYVFDDNMNTKVWHNVADWVIIALISVSSLEVFLSTFEGISSQYGDVLHFIDVFTTIVFTIEVSLRYWVCGKKYAFSFFGIIDFLSTYPFYLGLLMPIPVAALKILRVARLLRIFRYMKSFRILGEAVSSKKQELSISIVFLSILTVILSFLLYFAEHDAQPELCENGWQTMVWAFAKYLGDPGKIADFPLVTFWGHFIAAIVGFLGIAIFAVPAGLIGSGFVEVIEARNQEKKITEDTESIRHGFKWLKEQQYTNLYFCPPFQPIQYFLVKQFLTEADVVAAVKNSNNLHLYNLAKAYSTEDQVTDRVVVVACPHNRPYGVCIDRNSKVTIVSASSNEEPITGWVAYHIAKLGGFNYVSKEMEMDADNPVSYYNIANPDENEHLRLFIEDINRLSERDGSWVIPMCFCTGPKDREHSIHLCYSPVKHDHGYDNPDKCFQDSDKFDSFAKDLSKTMEESFAMKTDFNDYYVALKNNLIHRLNVNNGFALRMECKDIYFPTDKMAKIKCIADILNKHFEPEVKKQIPEEMIVKPADWFGFNGYREDKSQS